MEQSKAFSSDAKAQGEQQRKPAATDHTRTVMTFANAIPAIRIVTIYLLVASLWIFGSDYAIHKLPLPLYIQDLIELLKGTFFVCVTSLMIFLLLRRELNRHAISEKRFQALTANAADLTVLIDRHGIIQYVSNAAERMFGVSSERSVGTSFASWVHPDDLPTVLASFENRIQQGGTSSSSLCVRGKRADGSWRILEVMGTNLMNDPAVNGIVLNIRDVTERSKATERIRQLSNAVEHSGASVVITNPRGEIEYVNPAFCRVTGYTVEEVMGQNPRVLKSGYTQPDEYRHMWETITAGKEWRGEFNNRKKTGEMYWESASISPVLDEQGAVVSFVAVKEDITEKKIIERALVESERRFRTLIDSSVDCVVLLNSQGWITFATPSITTALGYSIDEYVGTPGIGYTHPDEITVLEGLFPQLMRGEGAQVRLRGRHRHKNGQWRWLEGTATNQLNDPSVNAIVLNFRDFTQRRDAEMALRDSLRYTDQVVNATPVGILTYRPTGECVSCNEAAAAIVGASREELLRQNFRTLDSWKRSGLFDLAEKTLRGEPTKPEEIRHLSTFGKEAWLSARFALFSIAGQPHLLLTVADFTERKQLNEQLRQAQKLESIGTLAGGIAHDFNNVLGILMAYLSVAGRDSTSPDRRASAMETMMTAVKRGAALVRQLLTFARRTESSKELFQMNGLINELAQMLRATFPPMIEIKVQTDEQLLQFLGDQSQLHRAMLNLCVNARDAMPHGGILRLSTAVIGALEIPKKFYPLASDQYLRVSVSDNGQGMSEDVQKRVFEPFFTTKGIGKGTGLGLSVLYGVVQSHGGFVDLRSVVGEGTTFNLFFPLPLSQVVPPSRTGRTGAAESSKGSGTIVQAEDELALA